MLIIMHYKLKENYLSKKFYNFSFNFKDHMLSSYISKI